MLNRVPRNFIWLLLASSLFSTQALPGFIRPAQAQSVHTFVQSQPLHHIDCQAVHSMPVHHFHYANHPDTSTNLSHLSAPVHVHHHLFHNANNHHHLHNSNVNQNSNNSVTNNTANNHFNSHFAANHILWGSDRSTHLWTNTNLANQNNQQQLNLDLSSNTQTMTLGHLLHSNSVTIDVGGAQMLVNAKTELTPAEYIAALQVIHGAHQSLVLTSDGIASSGTIMINGHLNQQLASLVIPQNVTVIDISKSGSLNLSGNLTDYGKLYLESFNPAVNTITVNANNISVQSQGSISDILSSSIITSLKPDSNLNLSLDSANNITNAGNIISSGSINLNAGSGNITNSGNITSNTGNINIATGTAKTDINLNAAGGTFQANNGNINFRDSSYAGANNININGGNYFANNLNLYSGTGAITGTVNQITATVNSYAGSEHFNANTENLILGNNNITGDPTYANTGNILISGQLTPTEAIAIIAGDSISTDSTGSISTNGSDVTIVAGAKITSGGGSPETIINSTAGVSSPVTFTFDNTYNGNIDFTASTTTPAIQTNGGNVTLLAHHVGAGTGNIWFPTTSIINTSNTSGSGGNILIVAGGQGGNSTTGLNNTAIQLGGLITAGATASGTVNVYTANPVITGGSATYNTNGALTSGAYPTNASAYTFNGNGQITVATSIVTAGNGGAGDFNQGSDGTAGADITIHAGNNISTSNLLAWGGGGGGGGPIGGSGGNGGHGGNISVTSDTGNISISGEVNSSGGGGGGTYSGGGGAGGLAGTISLQAGGSTSVTRSMLASNGGAGSNGFGPGGGGGGSFGGGGGGGGGFTASGGGGGNGAYSGGGGAGSNSSFANAGGGGGGWISGGGAAGDAYNSFGGTGVNGNAGATTVNGAWNPIGGTYGAAGGAGGSTGTSLQGGTGNSSFVAGGGQGGSAGSSGNGFAGNFISSVTGAASTYSQSGAGLVADNITLTNTAAPGSAATEITTLPLIAATGALIIQATGSGGGLVITGNVSGATTALTATGAGTITGAGIITGSTWIDLNGGSGTIGSLSIVTPKITFNSTGNITLVDSVALTSNGTSTGANVNITDSATGGITTTNTITASGSLNLTTQAANSSIVLGATVTAPAITLTVNTSGNIISTSSIISGAIALVSTSGNIGANSGATSPLLINNNGSGVVLYVDGAKVNIQDSQNEPVTLAAIGGASNIASTSLTLNASGSITTNSAVVQTNGTGLIFTSYNGTGNQYFTGSSFVNNSGTITVSINGTTYSNTFSSPIPNGNLITLTSSGGDQILLTNNTGSTLTTASSTVAALNTYFQNGSALFAGAPIQSPIISLTSTTGSIGTDKVPILAGNNGMGINSLLAVASSGNVYIFDTTHEQVILSNSSTNGTSLAGNYFLVQTYGNMYSAPNTSQTGLAIQAPIVFLKSTNGNIVEDSTNSSDGIQINGSGSGVLLYADAPTGSIAIADTTNETITLTTATSSLTSTAANNFVLNTVGSIYSYDAALAIQATAISLSSNANIGTNTTPISIAAANFTLNATGNVYITDSTALTSNGISAVGSLVFTDTANGGITITNSITANGALSLINTGTNAPISLNASISGNAVTLTATGSGAITQSSSVTNTVSSNAPAGVALNPAGTYYYVTNYTSGTVSVIQASNNTVVATIPVGNGPNGIAINPAGTYVYVTNQGSSNVSVINTTTNTVVDTVNVGNSPSAVAVTPSGAYAYISNAADGTVSVIQTSNNTVVSIINVGGPGTNPEGIAITPNGAFAYVATGQGNTIDVIQTATNTVAHTIIDFGANPSGIAINPAGTFAYVTNADANTVSVIQTSTNTIVGTINVGSTPIGIALDPLGNYGYVENYANNTVSVFQTSNNQIVSTLNVGTGPANLGNFIGAIGNNIQAYIANNTSDSISIIQQPSIIGSTSATLTSGSGAMASINISTPKITFNTTGTVSLYDLQALTSNGASTGSTVTLTDSANAGITTTNSITSTTLSLTNTGTDSPINIGGTLNAATIALTATGSGNITGNSPIIGTGLTLNSPSGEINVSDIESSIVSTSQTTGGSGSVNLTTTGAVTLNPSSSGTGGFSLNANGNINASSITTTGGSISLTSSADIICNGGIDLSANSIIFNAGGNITQGGLLAALNNIHINANNQITNENTGFINATNGNISFATTTGPGNLLIQNDGTINANNGIIGINGGSSGTITITGTGSISGTQAVNIGNLNPTSLQIQPFYSTVNPFTGTYTNQLGNINITQNTIAQPLQVSTGYSPPPSPSGGGSSSNTNNAAQTLFTNLKFLALEQSLEQQANNQLYEQIGTRIATDYTPWTTYPMAPQLYPLQGGVNINRISQEQGALFAASEFNANELTALNSQGIVLGPNTRADFLDLIKGYVLFMPTQNITVQTREGQVFIPKGAHAWIMETGADAAIYDLHDDIHTGPIKVTVNKKVLTIAPGTEVLLTRNSKADFASLNPDNTLGYRNVRASEVGGGIKVFVSDFSLSNGIANVGTIRQLLHSNNPNHKKAAEKIIKNAAILADLTGYNYKTEEP